MTNTLERDFEPCTVKSCCSANAFIQAQDTFAPERLIIPREIAKDFLVTDIIIGKNSQLISVGCLPAMMFSSEAFHVPLCGFDTVVVGTTMTISIVNQSEESRIFKATILGSKIKRDPTLNRKTRFLGLGNTLVKPHWNASVNIQPQLDFQPQRLIVPSTIHDNFKINGLSIRGADQHPWEKIDIHPSNCLFDENSPGRIGFRRMVKKEAFLTLDIQNMTNHAENFQGAVIGLIQ
jgi:hypothetical protein